MFKKSTPLFLFAETSIHLGSGESLGAVDLAIQREKHTDIPCGAAQGIKGAIRDWFTRKSDAADWKEKILEAFGPESTADAPGYAGAVAFTDARLLLFPVRSLSGIFAWITCPFVLKRFKRDMALATGSIPEWTIPDPDGTAKGALPNHSCIVNQGENEQKIVLDEEVFNYEQDEQVSKVVKEIKNYYPEAYSDYVDDLDKQLLVLSDNDFRHFVKTATEVQARIKLNENKTTGEDGNLFYQENLPADSLLYSLILVSDSFKSESSLKADDLLSFVNKLNGNYLQIGGDATTGKGYVLTRIPNLVEVKA